MTNGPLTQIAKNLADALRELVGNAPSSVEFVQDYVQMHFDGPCLTAYTPPTIKSGSRSLGWGQAGYRDELCEQIGRRVERAGANEDRVFIAFESGTEVSISLRPDDYRGPEALQFSLGDDRTWVA